jgi:hypothetical protein
LRENNVRRATRFSNLQNAWIMPTIIFEFHQDYRKCLCAPAAALAQRHTPFFGNILPVIRHYGSRHIQFGQEGGGNR